jgi:hypothetical protein
MGQTPDDMLGAVSASLAARTGWSLDEWVALVWASGIDPLDQNAVRGGCGSEHGIPQNSQWRWQTPPPVPPAGYGRAS